MADREVRVKLIAEVDEYVAAMERATKAARDLAEASSAVSQKIVVTLTDGGCRVSVDGIDITYWMAAGSAPAVSFPEGKPPVVTVHLTAENFEIRES